MPERGLVARNRRFPRTRDNRQSAPPSPFGKLGAPASPTSALGRPFRHLPAATRKGRSVRRGLSSSPFASRRGAAQRKAGGGARQGALRRLRLAPGTAAVALHLRLELQCGRGFAADDARLRHRTRKASSRALRSANTAPINSVFAPQLTRFTPALDPSGPCADLPQNPSQAHPRHRPRLGRESHAGCGILGSPSRPHEACGTASSRAPSKAPSVSAARIRKEGGRW